MNNTFKRLFMSCLAVLASCSKDADESGATSAKTASPPAAAPFELTVHKVEVAADVAPNEVWREQGLGYKAEEGHLLYCVQYLLRNTSTEEEYNAPVILKVDGESFEVQVKATGKYQREDWSERVTSKLAPGQASQESACFEVPESYKSSAGTIVMQKEPWGKHPGWKLSAPTNP